MTWTWCARIRTGRLAAAVLLLPAMVSCGAEVTQEGPPMEVVAEFADRQVTGVAVSREGRIFVNFPYWSDPHTLSVAEVVDGELQPYPNESWNATEGAPESRFVCVQSVYIDAANTLWILDPAAPRMGRVVEGGAKLLKVDLATGEVVQTIRFDRLVATGESYLNDVRIDLRSGTAFITDSGRGALVVVDLASGEARRVLEGHSSVLPERNARLVVEGNPLSSPGDPNRPLEIAADSIAYDPDNDVLYYKPLTGYTLYRIAGSALRDRTLGADELAAEVETVADAPASDGLAFHDGRIYFTAIEDNAIVVYDLEAKESGTLVSDPLLKWPDSLALGPGGDLYITTSQIHLTAQFNGGDSRVQEPFRVLKLGGAAVLTERSLGK